MSSKLELAVDGIVAEIRESLVDDYEASVVKNIGLTVERITQLDIMHRVIKALDDEDGTAESMYQAIKSKQIHIEPRTKD